MTPAAMAAAEAACNATDGCAATSGDCSCPCALFGTCVCECGGHYLRRCTIQAKRAFYEGVPPHAEAGEDYGVPLE